jgi:hypothetical protein
MEIAVYMETRDTLVEITALAGEREMPLWREQPTLERERLPCGDNSPCWRDAPMQITAHTESELFSLLNAQRGWALGPELVSSTRGQPQSNRNATDVTAATQVSAEQSKQLQHSLIGQIQKGWKIKRN